MKPLSPFDPAQPFYLYAPTQLIQDVQTAAGEASPGMSLQQKILPRIREAGLYPHLPTYPEGDSHMRMFDSSIRWAKPFNPDSWVKGDSFYLGPKKEIMRRLHANHAIILRNLKDIQAALERNPERYPVGFGTYEGGGEHGEFQLSDSLSDSLRNLAHPYRPGQRFDAGEALQTLMLRIRESHDLIQGLLDLPPAIIDPDLVLDWLGAVNAGPGYRYSGTSGTQVADEDTLKNTLGPLCALHYLPWTAFTNDATAGLQGTLVGQNSLMKSQTQLQAHVIRAYLMKPGDFGGVGKTPLLALPLLTETRRPGTPETDPPELILNPLALRLDTSVTPPIIVPTDESPTYEEENKKIAWKAILDLVSKRGLPAPDRHFDFSHLTPLSHHMILSELNRLAAMKTWLDAKELPITPEAVGALIQYYLRPGPTTEPSIDQNLEYDSKFQSSVHPHKLLGLWSLQRLRSQFANISALENNPDFLRFVSDKPGETEEEKIRGWVQEHLFVTQNYLCQSIAYQTFYDELLTQEEGQGGFLKGWNHPVPRGGDTRVLNMLTHPVGHRFFRFETHKQREDRALGSVAKKQGQDLLIPLSRRGWGYFYDYLLGFGVIPRYTRGLYQLSSDWLSSHTFPVFPGLLRSPFSIWVDMVDHLIHGPLDFTVLPEMGTATGTGKTPSNWLYQDSAVLFRQIENLVSPQRTDTIEISRELSRVSSAANVSKLEQLKEAGMYLFRNRTGFTPQEKYLFVLTYFKQYLVPLAYLMSAFSANVIGNPDIRGVRGIAEFTILPGTIDRELIHMLKGDWASQPDKAHAFIAGGAPGDPWQFNVMPVGGLPNPKALKITFLDPMLEFFQRPLPDENATVYSELEAEIGRISQYLDQRMQWCWNTSRQALAIENFQNTLVSDHLAKIRSEDSAPPASTAGEPTLLARDAGSPYLYPRKEVKAPSRQGTVSEEERFPIPLTAEDGGALDWDKDPAKRAAQFQSWLHHLCYFPMFIKSYLWGYVELARNYQRAMSVFRHAELFQRQKAVDTSYLTYIEGLPERVSFQRDYAYPSTFGEKLEVSQKLNQTVYARELDRYLREKQAYLGAYDRVQSMFDNAFKSDFTATDYVNTLEALYLGVATHRDKSFASILYNTLAQAYPNHSAFEKIREEYNKEHPEKPLQASEDLKRLPTFWHAVSDVINETLRANFAQFGGFAQTAEREAEYYICQPGRAFSERHLEYQNKLACSLQKQMVYRLELQAILQKYEEAVKQFLSGTPDPTSFASPADAFENLMKWAAGEFNRLLSSPSASTAAQEIFSQLKEEAKQKTQQKEGGGLDAGLADIRQAHQKRPDETLQWHDVFNEVERAKSDVLVTFLRFFVNTDSRFWSLGALGTDETSVPKEIVKRLQFYKSAVQSAYAQDTLIHPKTSREIKALYWFMGPNTLFEGSGSSINDLQLGTVKRLYHEFYPFIPVSGEKPIPGLVYQTEPDPSRTSRAKRELLRHFDHEVFKNALTNILNAKFLLMDLDTPLTETLSGHGVGGQAEGVRRWFMGTTDIYTTIQPFGYNILTFDRTSPMIRAMRRFLDNVPLLGEVDIGLTTSAGYQYALSAYPSEGPLVSAVTGLVNGLGSIFGAQAEPSVHIWMHKLFCKTGARLRGGGLLMDPIHQRSRETTGDVWLNAFSFKPLWDSSLSLNALNLWHPRKGLESGTHAGDEQKKGRYTLSTTDFVDDHEDFFCDVFSVSHRQPSTRRFTVQEQDTLNRAETQRLRTLQEAEKDTKFKQGLEETKKLQASRYYESAIWWTFSEMLHQFILTPLSNALLELQELYKELDLRKHRFYGDYVDPQGTNRTPWVEGVFQKIAGLKFAELLSGDGIFTHFSDKLNPDPNSYLNSLNPEAFFETMLEPLHLVWVSQLKKGESYRIMDNKVDHPGSLKEHDRIFKVLTGNDDQEFSAQNLLELLRNGKETRRGSAPQSCIDKEEVALIQETLLGPNGKKTESTFKDLSSEEQNRYLVNVRMFNQLSAYADTLNSRPGFCYLKKLLFNAGYRVLLGQRDWKTEEEEARSQMSSLSALEAIQKNEDLPCHRLIQEKQGELIWAVGQKAVENLTKQESGPLPLMHQKHLKTQQYCHALRYTFKADEVFRRILGYGADAPDPKDPGLTPSSPQQAVGPAPGQEPPSITASLDGFNLMATFQMDLVALDHWKQAFVDSVGLRFPQLDAQIGGDKAVGDVLTGESHRNPSRFIKRAYLEIVAHKNPFGNEPFLDELVDHIRHYPGPICEVVNAHLLSDPQKQQTLLTQRAPAVTVQNNTYLLASRVCSNVDVLSSFAYTRAGYEQGGKIQTGPSTREGPPKPPDLLEQRKTQLLKKQEARYEILTRKMKQAFPWMMDQTLEQGAEGASLLAWMSKYKDTEPSQAFYSFVAEQSGPAWNGFEAFLKPVETLDEGGSHMTFFEGILKQSIADSANLINQIYLRTHEVDGVLDRPQGPLTEEAFRRQVEDAKLDQVLSAYFSMPQLYDSIRKTYGPRYDPLYYHYVPLEVWRHYKAFEQYQSVAGTISSAIFVIQIAISLTPVRMLSGIFMSVERGIASLGLHRAVAWCLTSYLAVGLAGSLFASVAFQFFKIFGADWKPIQVAFMGAAGVAAIFMGLSRFGPMGSIFQRITPTLSWQLQIGWYFLVMDVVMYFGDKVTWDYATREYGYFKAYYDSTLMRMSFEIENNSSQPFTKGFKSVAYAMKREQDLAKEYGLNKSRTIIHQPLFSEFHYIKHLQTTANTAISYLWFGLAMASAMDYAQLVSAYRHKGAQPFPGYPVLSGRLPESYSGMLGEFQRHRTALTSQIQFLSNPLLSFPQRIEALDEFVLRRYDQLQLYLTDHQRLSLMMNDLIRSLGLSKHAWEDLSRHLKTFLTREILNRPERVARLKIPGMTEAAFEKIKTNLKQEIDRLDSGFLNSLRLDSQRFALGGFHPTLQKVFASLHEQGQPARDFLSDYVKSLQEAFYVDWPKFAEEFAYHSAKIETVAHYASSFRSYESSRIDLASRFRQSQGRAPSPLEIHPQARQQVILSADIRSWDNEREFRLIRAPLDHPLVIRMKQIAFHWRNTVSGIAGLGNVASRFFRDTFGAFRTWGHRAAVAGLPVPEGYSDAILGMQIAHAMDLQKSAEVGDYVQTLVDMSAMYHPILTEAHSQLSSLGLPQEAVDKIKTVLADMNHIRTFLGITDEGLDPSGRTAKFISEDERIGFHDRLRAFVECIAAGTLHPQGMVTNGSAPVLIRQLGAYRLNQMIDALPEWLGTLHFDHATWKKLISASLGTSSFQTRDQLPKAFAEVGSPHTKAQKLTQLVGHIMNQIALGTDSDQGAYAALVEFKRQLVMRWIEPTQFSGDTVVRLLSPEDLDLMRDVSGSKEEFEEIGRRVKTGEDSYLKAIQPSNLKGSDPSGFEYWLSTVDPEAIRDFYGTLSPHVEPTFGALGPYLVSAAYESMGADAQPLRQMLPRPLTQPPNLNPHTVRATGRPWERPPP
jgi:hypothetical protein